MPSQLPESLEDFQVQLTERIRRLTPGEADAIADELRIAVEDLALPPDEDLMLSDTWEVFAPIANLLTGRGIDDELFGVFLNVWVSPTPEEQYLDRYEFEDAVAEANFPAEFMALVEGASQVYAIDDDGPILHAALYSDDVGWALAYPDRVLRFATPLDLLDFMIAEAHPGSGAQ